MAYSTSGDAGFRITSMTHDGNALSGAMRCTLEKIIEREVIQSEAENSPTSRPVDRLDARVVAGCLDGSDMIAETVSAGNFVASFSQADGGSGSVTLGPLVANGYTGTMARNQGGHQYEQEFVMEGTTLTETISF